MTTTADRLAPENSPDRLDRAGRIGTVLWCAVVAVSIGWGAVAITPHPEIKVAAAPLFGHWGFEAKPGLLLVMAMAALIIGIGPRVATTLPWRKLIAMAAAGGAVWSLTLNLAGGWHMLANRLTGRHQYEPFAAKIDDPRAFLDTFTERISGYPVHVRGHPPGATLVPWVLDRVGLGSASWFEVLIIAGWGLSIAATLVAARAVAGEAVARRSAPALVLLPGALWAVQADGLFAGVSACSVSLAVVALVRRRHHIAALAGVVFALALMLTYGAAALVIVLIAVAIHRRSLLPLLVTGAFTILTLVAIWAATGFSWLEGIEATRGEYWAGVAARRPSPYFVLAGNPGALALAVGPAVFAGLGAVCVGIGRTRRNLGAAAVLPLGALAAVMLANASLLSKAEVERIWLLFMPWLALGTAALSHRRRWLVAQGALAVVLLVALKGS